MLPAVIRQHSGTAPRLLANAAVAYVSDARIDPAARAVLAEASGLRRVLDETVRRERVDAAFATLARYLRTDPSDNRDTELRRSVLAEVGRMHDDAVRWL